MLRDCPQAWSWVLSSVLLLGASASALPLEASKDSQLFGLSSAEPLSHTESRSLFPSARLPRRAPNVPGSCDVHWFEQKIDHFSWNPPPLHRQTYMQRYFVCSPPGWKAAAHPSAAEPLTIFYYFGNEDDVELYLNNTGLMWESAPLFQAVLVFAEHRYYGKSRLFPPGTPGCMNYLTTEQAMADNAVLLEWLRADPSQPEGPRVLPWDKAVDAVIGFGGSYGGMLGTWFRMKYPHLVDGLIAGSAPIWSFMGMNPPYDKGAYYKIVTRDASSAGGASDNCRTNIRNGQPLIAKLANSQDGRALLSKAFRTCQPIKTSNDALGLIPWVQEPWSWFAMGNFPYPSGYVLHGKGQLPAWPVRAACKYLDELLSSTDLLEAMRMAAAVYFNHSGSVSCFYNGETDEENSPPTTMRNWHNHGHGRELQRLSSLHGGPADACVGDWGYQWCTEMVQPFSSNGVTDMFWPPNEFNLSESIKGCVETWGVSPRPYWALSEWGDKDLTRTSNIVFSNGLLDPWSGGGVLTTQSDTVVALTIPSGAHHLDFMFSHPDDPADVVEVRATERKFMKKWITEAYIKRRNPPGLEEGLQQMTA